MLCSYLTGDACKYFDYLTTNYIFINSYGGFSHPNTVHIKYEIYLIVSIETQEAEVWHILLMSSTSVGQDAPA